MGRGRNLEREQYWRALIEEHAASGQPVSTFCRERNVSAGSFFTWRRKLAGRDRADTAAKFMPVQLQAPAVSPRTGCEIVLLNGCRVIVSTHCDATWLHEILRALQPPC